MHADKWNEFLNKEEASAIIKNTSHFSRTDDDIAFRSAEADSSRHTWLKTALGLLRSKLQTRAQTDQQDDCNRVC